jgi:hypothetical protein
MSRLGTGLKAVPDRLQWLEFNWEWIIVRPLRPTPDLGAGRSKGPERAHRNECCGMYEWLLAVVGSKKCQAIQCFAEG